MVERIQTVDEISDVLLDAMDNLSANIITREEAVLIVKNIVSIKTQRLKILDGNEAKSKFASKMGKRRLAKFYSLLCEAEG